MNTKSLLTRIGVPVLSLGLLGGLGATLATSASASTLASSSDVSAYYYNPSGNALGGPQPMGQFGSAHASFAVGPYLAKVTEKVNNENINNKTITITGHLDPGTVVSDQPNGGDSSTPPGAPNARVYFEGSGGGVSDGSPDGYLGQHWWANGAATVYLNDQGTTEFILTIPVTPNNWSDWNGQLASANADLFTGAASHVRNIGLSFGGGYFFENGVTGTGGLTIDSIHVG